MNKKIVLSLAIALASGTAMAGGLNTNTNANAAFLRYFAQDANITLTSLYANPAGSAFLSKGWHFGICDQIAIQQRNVTTQFGLFQYNPNNGGSDTHYYQGKAFAPLIPSADFSYNSGKKWSINAHLGVVGGGGACEYLDGIGSFEALYAGKLYSGVGTKYVSSYAAQAMAAGIPQATAVAAGKQAWGTLVQNGQFRYNTDAYMKGSSYMFGLQVGATYKITDNLAVFAGIRGIYATANYNGYVQDVMYSYDGGKNYTYASQSSQQQVGGQTAKTDGQNYTLSMNCDQTGFGVTPILGIHWTINKHWNVAAKYEFKTRIRMHSTTRMNRYTQALCDPTNENYNATIASFKDGGTTPDDIPGYLAIGTQYSPIENVRIGLAYHWMQDSKANKGITTDANGNIIDKSSLINKDTHEVLASAEWKCWKYLTVSAGWQRTMYGQSDAYMNDVSFNCSSNSIGCGVRIHPSKLFNIDLGYMHTIYNSRTVTTETALGNKIDTYNRKNDVIGVGLNFAW